VFYEAPYRILDTLADVEGVFGETQHVVIARELTKLHEEFLRGQVHELRKNLTARATVRGEIVLMIALDPADNPAGKKTSLANEVSALMKLEGISEMDALKRVARERGIGKSEAYRELQREQNRLR
jgi:16S rRNA (cytidine1402-2'-O)-methyltransferase